MHILKEVCYVTTSIPVIHFSMVVSLFHGSTWSDSYVKGTVFISHQLLWPSIIKKGLCLIRENLEGTFIWGKPLYPCSFKGFYSAELVAVNCLKSKVSNARKHLQWSHSYGECVNLTIPQQQLQFFKVFRRAIVDICI